MFPAHQMHRVTPVSFGQRVTVVGWVTGEANERYWESKEAVMKRTLAFAKQEEHGDVSTVPDLLTYRMLISYNQRLTVQRNWEQLLSMTEWQIDLTDKMFDEAGLRQGSLHAEELGLALVRYSWAASTIGNSVGIARKVGQRAWASCERAAWLLSDKSQWKAHALEGMAAWERVVGPQTRTQRPRRSRPSTTPAVCCDWPGHGDKAR